MNPAEKISIQVTAIGLPATTGANPPWVATCPSDLAWYARQDKASDTMPIVRLDCPGYMDDEIGLTIAAFSSDHPGNGVMDVANVNLDIDEATRLRDALTYIIHRMKEAGA